MKPFEDIPMDKLLPQQPPFRFAHTLVSYSPEVTVVGFSVGSGHMLMDGDTLSAAGLLEHMAQASAARQGYLSRYILKEDVAIGFIGQVKKYDIRRLPVKGERLTTYVTLLQDFFKISLVDVQVKVGEELIASASMKFALAQ